MEPIHARLTAAKRDRNPAAYEAAGLSYDTKFDLKQVLDLPFTTEWFSVPPAAPQGQTAYFSPSWTAFQADRGRYFSVIVDGVSV